MFVQSYLNSAIIMEKEAANLAVKLKDKVLIVHNQQCQLHTSSRKHPELPFRITAILNALSHVSVLEVSQLLSSSKLEDIPTEKVQALISSIHGERYFEFVQYMWDQSYKKSEMYINTDTYYMKHTYTAALAAVRTVLLAAKALITRQFQHAFAVVRPPGHHSGFKSQPHGFSFFNNVAIAAEFALKSAQYHKIAIIDWDAHHGEGTQHIFYKRKDVLYISLHRFDNGKFFPHVALSSSQHCGQGDGIGYNINICWNLPEKKPNSTYERDESVGDEEYAAAFSRIVMPILQKYEPDMILVSCGFDSGDGDSIGNLKVSKQGYMMMTQRLKSLKVPILAVLEGGYSEEVLSWASKAVVEGLSSNDDKIYEKFQSLKPNKIGEEGITKCLSEVGKFWNLQ